MTEPSQLHPGHILLEDYLLPMGISGSRLAIVLRVAPNRITDIIRGRRGITADTAHRLARACKTTPEFWMNLQTAHELSRARISDLDKIEPITGITRRRNAKTIKARQRPTSGEAPSPL